jgi:hypothetical protein
MMTAMSVAMSTAVAAVVEMPVAMMTPAAVAVTPSVAVAPMAPSVAVAPAPAVSAPAVGTPAADPAGLFDRALIVDDASCDARGQWRGLRGRQTRAGGENESGGGRGRDNEAIHGKCSCCIGTSLQQSVTALDRLGRTVAIPAAGLAAASAKPSRPPKNAGFDLNPA